MQPSKIASLISGVCFESKLQRFVPKPGMPKCYKAVICDVSIDDKQMFDDD